MQIDITKVLKIIDKPFSISFSEAWPSLGIGAEEIVFKKPVTFEGTLTNKVDYLLLQGVITSSYTRACGRCLDEFETPLQAQVEEKFYSTKSEVEDDGGVNYYEGNELDIVPQIQEQIIFNTAISGLCNEDCKGLCPQCGSNLNKTSCKCVSDQVDPRLQVLSKLLNT